MLEQRRCIVINRRSAIALVLMFVMSGVRQSQTAGNYMVEVKNSTNTNSNGNNNDIALIKNNDTNTNSLCPSGALGEVVDCATLVYLPSCIRCNYNYSCIYGKDLNVKCDVLEHIPCHGERTFTRQMNCRYCYQTEMWQQTCVLRGNCNSANAQYYRTNCTVNTDVFCLGNRSFSRNVKCNWTQGYRWSTALIISITLGGFGVDRFYLGHWQEGIGKLFSFGGLGVWTIIDVVLISLHYLGPADGSLYI